VAGRARDLVLAVVQPAFAGPKPPTDPCPGGLEPNLVPIVPHHLQIQNTGDRTLLRLTNGIANVSGGPWHLHPLNVLAGEGGTTTAIQDIWAKVGGPGDPTARIARSIPTTQFAFHPAHNHWHIGSVARSASTSAATTGSAARWVRRSSTTAALPSRSRPRSA
jgi:hypothetical protein